MTIYKKIACPEATGTGKGGKVIKMYRGKTHTVYGIAYFNDVIYSSIFYENEDDAEQFVNDGIGEKIIKVHLSDESYKVLKRKGVIR